MTISVEQSKVTGFHSDQNKAMVSFHHPLCPLRNEAFTMTRIPTSPLPLKTSGPHNSEVQEETRDHAARWSKQRRDTCESRIPKRKKVKFKVRIYFTLTLSYALIRGVRSETAEVWSDEIVVGGTFRGAGPTWLNKTGRSNSPWRIPSITMPTYIRKKKTWKNK